METSLIQDVRNLVREGIQRCCPQITSVKKNGQFILHFNPKSRHPHFEYIVNEQYDEEVQVKKKSQIDQNNLENILEMVEYKLHSTNIVGGKIEFHLSGGTIKNITEHGRVLFVDICQRDDYR